VLEVVTVLAPRKLAEQVTLPIESVCPTTLDAPLPNLPPLDLQKLGFADVTNGTAEAAIITLIGTVLPWPMVYLLLQVISYLKQLLIPQKPISTAAVSYGLGR
jgi:hypothetical protein